MQPTTSYWPPVRSPGCSLGTNEYGCPQRGQKPVGRPGFPFLLCPTGSPHFPQTRLFSATSGLASTTVLGSFSGTGGTSTIPAPRLPRRVRVEPVRRDPVQLVPVRALIEDGDDPLWALSADGVDPVATAAGCAASGA